MRIVLFINIFLFSIFFQNIQAQEEVESPPEELANKTWYLTKLVMDEEEIPFIPDEEIQKSTFSVGSISENIIEMVTVAYCNQGSTGIKLEGEDEFYFGIFAYLAYENDWWCDLEENNDFHYLYFEEFWNNPDLEIESLGTPFHFSYEIYQLENYQELIVTNDNGDEAYYQNIELSVQDNEKNSVTFYPNPAQEEIYIENLTATAEIEIYTISGKKLLQQQVNSSTESINISNLSAGIYFYAFKRDGKILKRGKLLKE